MNDFNKEEDNEKYVSDRKSLLDLSKYIESYEYTHIIKKAIYEKKFTEIGDLVIDFIGFAKYLDNLLNTQPNNPDIDVIRKMKNLIIKKIKDLKKIPMIGDEVND